MAKMKLQEFVSTTLTEILKGIVGAQKDPEVGQYVATGGIGHPTFPAESGVFHEAQFNFTTVKFDVAVTVESQTGGTAGAGLAISVVEAKFGGEIAERSEGISRVQFAVHLVLPESESTKLTSMPAPKAAEARDA